MTEPPAIEVSGVVKHFGAARALDVQHQAAQLRERTGLAGQYAAVDENDIGRRSHRQRVGRGRVVAGDRRGVRRWRWPATAAGL